MCGNREKKQAPEGRIYYMGLKDKYDLSARPGNRVWCLEHAAWWLGWNPPVPATLVHLSIPWRTGAGYVNRCCNKPCKNGAWGPMLWRPLIWRWQRGSDYFPFDLQETVHCHGPAVTDSAGGGQGQLAEPCRVEVCWEGCRSKARMWLWEAGLEASAAVSSTGQGRW